MKQDCIFSDLKSASYLGVNTAVASPAATIIRANGKRVSKRSETTTCRAPRWVRELRQNKIPAIMGLMRQTKGLANKSLKLCPPYHSRERGWDRE